MNPQEKEVVIGNDSDFNKFVNQKHIQKHDRSTLNLIYKIANKMKQVLCIQHIGPRVGRATIFKLQDLQKLNSKQKIHYTRIHNVWAPLPKDKYLVFSNLFAENDQIGTAHKDAVGDNLNNCPDDTSGKVLFKNDGEKVEFTNCDIPENLPPVKAETKPKQKRRKNVVSSRKVRKAVS